MKKLWKKLVEMLNKEKLNKIGLDYISLKVLRGRNNIYCIDSDIEDAINVQEPSEKYIIDVWIDIIGIKKDSDKEIKIGKLEGNYFEPEMLIDNYTFYEICDCKGADLELLATAITDKDGYIKEM